MHTHLHSFPTRRSSDLRSGPIPKANPVYSFGSYPAISNTLGCTMPAPKISIHPDFLQTEHPSPLQTLDRKSTRLNSSHVSTSYAAFCSKKKKNHRIMTQSSTLLQLSLLRTHNAHTSTLFPYTTLFRSTVWSHSKSKPCIFFWIISCHF